MKIKYSSWSAEQKQMLDELASRLKLKSGKVNWDDVQKYFPERTIQQCKSIYQNTIKEKLEKDSYHKWTFSETLQLYGLMQLYEGRSIKQIHDIYFHHLSYSQVKAKAMIVRRTLLVQEEAIDKIIKGDMNIPEQDLFAAYDRIMIARYISQVSELQIQCSDRVDLPPFPKLIQCKNYFEIPEIQEYLNQYPMDPMFQIALRKHKWAGVIEEVGKRLSSLK